VFFRVTCTSCSLLWLPFNMKDKEWEVQSWHAPLKTHAYTWCRLHNTHHDVASHCVKCTCGNWWQRCQHMTSFPAIRHSRAMTALLCRKLATGEIDIALIQDPWVYGDWIRGLRNIRGTLFSAGPSIAPRSCIFVRNTVHAFPMSELCSRDVTMVRMTYTRGGSKMELIVTSA
jgi:hypothetical protein